MEEPKKILTLGRGKIILINKRVPDTGIIQQDILHPKYIDFDQPFCEQLGLEEDVEVDYFIIQVDGHPMGVSVSKVGFAAPDEGQIIEDKDKKVSVKTKKGEEYEVKQKYLKESKITVGTDVTFQHFDPKNAKRIAIQVIPKTPLHKK